MVNKLYVFEERGQDEKGNVIGKIEKTNNKIINDFKLRKAGIL